MARRKRSRNAPCSCGSGKQYKHCCWHKGFAWVEDEQGQVGREVPLSADALAVLDQQRQKFRQRCGRDPGPDGYASLVTLRRGDLRRVNKHRLDLFGPLVHLSDENNGRESSLVGRSDFKSE